MTAAYRRARLREFAERWPDPVAAVARGTRATVENLRPRMAVEEEQERIADLAARIIQESGDPRTVVHFVGPPILPRSPPWHPRLLALAVALSLALWAVAGATIWAALR